MRPEFGVMFNLSNWAASWQFLQFLINCEIRRPEGHRLVVNIKHPGKYRPSRGRSKDDAHMLYEHVMVPSLELIKARLGNGSYRDDITHFSHETVVAAKAGHKIPKWRVPPQSMAEAAEWLHGRKPLVITLRECAYWPGRNSNIEAWTEFARTCGEDVVFVRDTATADEPLDGFETCPRASKELLFRAALMEQAKCNLLVANGPVMLAWYGTAPFMNFKLLCPEEPDYRAGRPAWWEGRIRVSVGEQLPWARPTQRLEWKSDTYDEITRAWGAISDKISKEAA